MMSESKESVESDFLPRTSDGTILQEKEVAAASAPLNGHTSGFFMSIWKHSSRREVIMMLCAVAAAIIVGAARPLMMVVFGTLINDFNSVDVLSSAEFSHSVNHNVLYYVYLFIAQFVLTYVYGVLLSITSTKITGRLRFKYLQSILGQDMAYLETCTAGAVASDVSETANIIQSGLSEFLGMAAQGTTELAAAFIIAFIESWKLTLVMIPAVATLIAGTILIAKVDSKFQTKVSECYKQASSMVEEALGSIRSITVLGAQPKIFKKYLVYLEQARRLSFRRSPVVGAEYPFAYFVLLSAYALAYWYGIRLYLDGQIKTGGRVVVVVLCVNMATNSLLQLIPAVGMVLKAKAATKTIMKTIERRPDTERQSKIASVPNRCEGRIVMNNVCFSYPSRPNIDVLKSMSLVFEPQKSTALIGPSGGGKSTIMDLLDRWIEPSQGNIYLDGTNIKDLDMKWYRSQIRVVEQEPRLFDDTIFRNVADGLSLKGTDQGFLPKEFIRALVRQACREANIHSFIETLPQGYDTRVGEQGNRLSGGQKQRIAIARAIVSNPRILLLDEATSALDDQSERLVQEALKNISKYRTTITIAHKLSTIQNADQILVIDQGRLIEQGNHEELLWFNGLYKSLFQSQYLTKRLNSLAESGELMYTPEEPIKKDLMTKEGLLVTQEEDLNKKSEELEPAEAAHLIAGRSLFRCLWIIFKSQRQLQILLVPGIIACIAAAAVYPIQSVLFAKVFTAFTLDDKGLKHAANLYGLLFFCLAIEVFVAFAVLGITFSLMAAYNSFFYRAKYFDAMLNQDLAFFSQGSTSAGGLTAKLSSHTGQLQALVSTTLGLLLVIIVDLISSLALALAVGWKLALVALFGSLPPIILAGYLRVNIETKVANISEDLILESARYASEVVDMVKTVTALALEDTVLKRFHERLGQINARSSARAARNMLLFAFAQSARLLGMALSFWYGGVLLARHEITAYAYFVIFTAVVTGGEAAGEFFAGSNNLVKARSAAIQILDLLSRRPTINHAPGQTLPPPPTDPSTPKLALQNVNFTYPNSGATPISTLNNTTISIQPHRTTALVGRSGAGKSTILSLLARLYDPTSGTVLFDGVPLTKIATDAYRSAVALVTQDIHLFQGTLRENILLGVPEYDPRAEILDADIEKRMQEACRQASLHDWIQSLPEGYETLCGQKGRSFSGGQRQRIALARALVRGCKVLILDEATSALDAENERKVYEALADIERDGELITVVVVAHRLGTVRKADEIIVLEEGGVVKESGGHHELLEKQGAYWEMYKQQDVERHRTGVWI